MSTSQEEHLRSQIMVLKDALRRAGWYLGTDKQAHAPTQAETEEFLLEVRDVLGKETTNNDSQKGTGRGAGPAV